MLLCLKVKYPDRITLLRGNHESRYHKIDLDKLQLFMVFMTKSIKSMEILILGSTALKFLITYLWEPLSIVIFFLIIDKVFCVHGGLSP